MHHSYSVGSKAGEIKNVWLMHEKRITSEPNVMLHKVFCSFRGSEALNNNKSTCQSRPGYYCSACQHLLRFPALTWLLSITTFLLCKVSKNMSELQYLVKCIFKWDSRSPKQPLSVSAAPSSMLIRRPSVGPSLALKVFTNKQLSSSEPPTPLWLYY